MAVSNKENILLKHHLVQQQMHPMLRRLSIFLFATLSAATMLADDRPNILFIYTDDQSYRTVGCYKSGLMLD
jgi:hypothetical protein